jgi:hypothetical protein
LWMMILNMFGVTHIDWTIMLIITGITASVDTIFSACDTAQDLQDMGEG